MERGEHPYTPRYSRDTTMLYNNFRTQQQNEIASLEAELLRIQERILCIQEQAQDLNSDEAKMETALALLQEAVASRRLHNPELLEIARSAALAIFDGHQVELPLLPPVEMIAEVDEPAPATSPDASTNDDTIDVPAEAEIINVDEEITDPSDDVGTSEVEEEVVDDRPITKVELLAEGVGTLRQIARYLNLRSTGTKDQVSDRLLETGLTANKFADWKSNLDTAA